MYRHDDCMCKPEKDYMSKSKDKYMYKPEDDCMSKLKDEHMDHMAHMEHMEHMEHMYKHKEYARAYILPQKYENLFSCKEGFLKGTIFKDLYRPYHDYKKSKCER